MQGASGNRFVLSNVRVFDGRIVGEPTSVAIDGSVIGGDVGGAEIIDGAGGVLVPGFIDAHVHLDAAESLDVLAAHGVTTVLDMGTLQADVVASARARAGTASLYSAGVPIIGSAGVHAQVPGVETVAVIHGPEDAEAMVARRVADGSDYIKLILEAPGDGGPDARSAKAVVAAAHARGLQVVAHVTTPGAYAMGIDAGVDVLTHVPMGARVPDSDIERLAGGRHAVVPTLTMMQGCAETFGFGGIFEDALANAVALWSAGATVLAGTDANATPGLPFHPPLGASLHHELELLVRAGVSTAAALEAATVLPARQFGLTDRGRIAPGMRADLVLLDGDPIADIRATRAIRRIWCGGIEHAPAAPPHS
ncbi:amidohydrolase family protein [Nocardia huaxiensis]|uniref:Amidohydrolase family protein n=1 Tax=Nocardia huaxiensis TaxID=2755382 RepID=A0A7D6V6C8_9NOCA|nr:amidohydrolase family protein [Nocardia huaxiensis]QLY28632.1 amidohydrolase family protein [Nocardia huaxiensis]